MKAVGTASADLEKNVSVSWSPKKFELSFITPRPADFFAAGKSCMVVNALAWFSGLFSQVMNLKAASGSLQVRGRQTNDPPLLPARTGGVANRHFPLVSGAIS